MSREGRLDELLESLYAAGVEPALWPGFLEQLSGVFDGAPSIISLEIPSFSALEQVAYASGMPTELPASVREEQSVRRPRADRGVMASQGRFVRVPEEVPNFAETLTYLGWLKPQGLGPEGLIMAMDIRDGRAYAGISLFRRAGQPRFSDSDLDFANELAPHLLRAYAIHGRLAGVSHERQVLTEVVDRFPMGIVLVDADRRPVFTSRGARRVLAERDGLVLDENCCRAQDPEENRVLQDLLDEAIAAAREGRETPDRVATVSRPSGKRTYPVRIAPLDAQQEGLGRAAVAALYFSDVERRRSLQADILSELYGLTRSEAEFAVLLCEGRSVIQVAEARGIKESTARWQLRQVFAKTNTNRQGELVRLLMGDVLPRSED